MEFAFYICGLIAILATLRVVTHTNPVHALLYLIISLLAIAGVFFLAGRLLRRCAGNHRLRRGHYGAVRLRGDDAQPGRHRDRTGAQVAAAGDLDWPGHPLRGAAGGYRLRHPRALTTGGIDGAAINAKEVGIALFGPYVLAVELASMLLLAGPVVAFHIGREERAGEVLSNRLNDSDKRKRRNTHDPLNTWTDPRGHPVCAWSDGAGDPPQSAVYVD